MLAAIIRNLQRSSLIPVNTLADAATNFNIIKDLLEQIATALQLLSGGGGGVTGPAGASGPAGPTGPTGPTGGGGGGSYYALIPTDFSTIQGAIDAGARRIVLENSVPTINLTAQITIPADEEVSISGPQARDLNQNGGGFPNFGDYVEINAVALGTTAAFLIGARGRLNLLQVRLVNSTSGATLIEYADPDSFFHAEGCNLDADVGNSTIISSPSTGFGDNIYADFIGCAIEMTDSSTDYTVPQASLVVRGNPLDFLGDPSTDWHHFGLMVNTSVRDVSQYGHATAVGNQPSGNDDPPSESRIEGAYVDAIHIDIASQPTGCFFLSTPSIDPASGGVSAFVPLISFTPYFTGSQDSAGGPVAVGCKISILPNSTGWGSAPYSIDGLYVTPFINRAFDLQNCKIIIKETNGGTPKINFTNQFTFANISNCMFEGALSGSQQPLGNLLYYWGCAVDHTRFYQMQAMFSDDLNRSSYFRDCQFDHCFVQDGGVGFSGTPAFDCNDGMELRDCTFTTPARIGATTITPPTNPGYMRIGGPIYNCRFNQIADESFGWEGFIERIRVETVSSPAVDPGYGDFAVVVKDCIFGAGIDEVLVYNVQTPFSTADWINQHAEVSDNVFFGDLQVGQATATNLIATVTNNTQIGKTSSGADIHAGSTTTPLQLLVSGRRSIVRGNSLYRPIANAPTLGTAIGAATIFVAAVANNVAPTTTFIGTGTNDVFTDDSVAGTYSIAF